LRQALKKGRDLNDVQEADWLVIDDICKIEKSNSSSWTKETIDDFVTSRSHDGKPTILIFDFDVDKVSLSDTMGTGIAKIVESSNTYRIKV
jgi:DNA replication protein DnaC